MFKLFANIFGYVLNFIYGIVNNYGVAIIIFTILLKLVLLPMNIKQQKTMNKSAKIQAEMKEIQDKYANDSVRMTQEVQDLYKRENMSPFSGCLSSIVQLIVLISIFYIVANPLTYMKHLSSDTIAEYKTQIEEMGVDTTRYAEIAIIRNLGDTVEEVDINMEFLGLNLSDVPTENYTDFRVFVIPILYVITSIISMKLTTVQTSKKKKEDQVVDVKKEDEKLTKVEEKDEQAEMMEAMNKNMRYMTPIMAVMVSLIAPLGLALYWFVSNLFMILQRIALNKFIKEEE